MLPPQPQFPYKAWSDANELNEQVGQSFEVASGCSVMWRAPFDSHEQAFSTAQPEYVNSNAEESRRSEVRQ